MLKNRISTLKSKELKTQGKKCGKDYINCGTSLYMWMREWIIITNQVSIQACATCILPIATCSPYVIWSQVTGSDHHRWYCIGNIGWFGFTVLKPKCIYWFGFIVLKHNL